MTTTTLHDTTPHPAGPARRSRRSPGSAPSPPSPAPSSSSATRWPGPTPRPRRPTALAGSSAQPAALLLGIYALLALAVAGSLAARLGRDRDTGAIRLIPVLAPGTCC